MDDIYHRLTKDQLINYINKQNKTIEFLVETEQIAVKASNVTRKRLVFIEKFYLDERNKTYKEIKMKDRLIKRFFETYKKEGITLEQVLADNAKDARPDICIGDRLNECEKDQLDRIAREVYGEKENE